MRMFRIMPRLFPFEASHSKVSLVRIATTLEDLEMQSKQESGLKIKVILLALILCKLQH